MGVYKDLAEAIPRIETPTERHKRLIADNRKDQFKHPEGDGKLSLLAIAITWKRWEWYRLLLPKCDPFVEWELDDGSTIAIHNKLTRIRPIELSHEMLRELRAAKDVWEDETSDPTVLRKPFPKSSAAILVLGAAAVAAVAATGGAAAPIAARCRKFLRQFLKDVDEWKRAKKDDGQLIFVVRDGVFEELDDTLCKILELQKSGLRSLLPTRPTRAT
eukprot:g10420.t1